MDGYPNPSNLNNNSKNRAMSPVFSASFALIQESNDIIP
jgi:hypothetical protein